jgi:HAD superfamily hydrolase (TIGR01484 family)
MKKLFAFDVDGTLINAERTLAPATVQAIRQLRQNGHLIAVITGRVYPPTDLLAELQVDAWVTANGSRTHLDQQIHWPQYFDNTELDALFQLLHPAREFAIAANNGKVYLSHFEHSQLEWILGRGDGLPLAHWQNQAIFNLEIHGAPLALRHTLEREFPHLELAGFPSEHTHSHFLQITPTGATKGRALERLAHHFGLTAQDCLAFGDGENDLSMLEWAGTGVQVGDLAILQPVADQKVSCSQIGLPQYLNTWLERSQPTA